MQIEYDFFLKNCEFHLRIYDFFITFAANFMNPARKGVII